MEWLLRNRYGSLELSRQGGPVLLRGLAGSVLVHALAVTTLVVMAMVHSGDHRSIGKLEPPIEITLTPTRPYVPPQVVPQRPSPRPPDAVGKPISVENPPIDPEVSEPIVGKPGIPGPEFVPGTGTKPMDPPPVIGEIPDDGEIPPIGTFVAHEYEPQPLDINPQPEYPAIPRLSGTGGTVKVMMYVDAHGDVRKWEIMSVDPKGLGFEEEVAKVVPKWKFTPAIQQGRPVSVWVSVPFTFRCKK